MDCLYSSVGNLALESMIAYHRASESRYSWLRNSRADYFCFVNQRNTTKFVSIGANDLRHLVKMESIKRVARDDSYRAIDLYPLLFSDYKNLSEVIEIAA